MKTKAINIFAAACGLVILSCNSVDTLPPSTAAKPLAAVVPEPAQEPVQQSVTAETGFIQRPPSTKKRVVTSIQPVVDYAYQPAVNAISAAEQVVAPQEEANSKPKQSLYDFVAAENTTKMQINSVFGGIVTGKQGTEIEFPADAFELEDSTEYEGLVNISFEEYFTKTDFILANLSSVSEGKLIESSGMFNITATTVEGKKLRLKKTKTASLKLPKDKKAKPGTTIFYADHSVASNSANANANASANNGFSFLWRVQGSTPAPQATTILTKAQLKR